MARCKMFLFLLCSCFSGISGLRASQEWCDSLQNPYELSLSLEECVERTPAYSRESLLVFLHYYAASEDKKALEVIAQSAYEKTSFTEDLLNLALLCWKAQLYSSALKVGAESVETATDIVDLVEMAHEYHHASLGDLSDLAAKKAVAAFTDDSFASRYVPQKLAAIGSIDLAERAYLHCISQETDWMHCFYTYQDLRELRKQASAQKAFNKALSLLKKDAHRYSAGWYMYIAKKCHEKGYIHDSKKAAYAAVRYESSVDALLDSITYLIKLAYDECVHKGCQQLLKKYRENPLSYSLLKVCRVLITAGQQKAAEKLFNERLSFFDHISYVSDLVELIMVFHKANIRRAVHKGLAQLLAVCQPYEYMFDRTTFRLLPASVCLQMVAFLAKRCNQETYAQQAAERAISCAFAEWYEGDELLIMLEDLATNFGTMELPYFAQKAAYYRAQAESPSLTVRPHSKYRLFSIHWTLLEGAQGCEIRKRRPCVVLSAISSYGKQQCVIVVPLSTKQRRELTSIPLLVNDVYQEGRIDQMRTVDITRLERVFGELPDQQALQLSLAVKNFLGT